MKNFADGQPKDEVEAVYLEQLYVELFKAAAEKIIQAQPAQRRILERLLDCEGRVPIF
ncbi:MAG: hypothetical protein HC824_13750 [Synechococcales cyanobacterium RM1_1_8]|nr:hypothetical protein [Synechococcales cyanobacterium RM1_1_8]